MYSEYNVNILLVDDHLENLLSLKGVLEPLNANLVQATSGEEALRFLLEQDFALILLDVQMPGMDGFETASLIRKRRRSRQTPIIFLTAYSSSPELLSKGYSLGAVDYLHKPLDPAILLSKATVFVDLFKKTLEIQEQSIVLEQQANQLVTINAQLRQSEEQFRLLSEGSPIGIFLTNCDGDLTYTNPRFGIICGFSSPVSLQAGFLQSIHLDDQAQMLATWAAYLVGEQEWTNEFRILHQDTLRWVAVRSRRLFSDQQELLGHLGTVEDITERKQAEVIHAQMIREQVARQEAEAINRLKDEFLAVLSHELRTPLTAIMGWAKILCGHSVDEVILSRGLSTIQRNALAQSQLIEDLLDVSRIIQGKLTINQLSVSLGVVVEAAIESVRLQAQAKSIQLIPALDAQKIQVRGDSMRLQQVVCNLLTNAIKFTPEHGQIDIQLSLSGNDSQFAEIIVRDTGIGIDLDFLPYVFDRFKQADSTTTRSYNGLGLGLAIVRHLVDLHGGTVQAESLGRGQGATFTVRLPVYETSNLGRGQNRGDTLQTVSVGDQALTGQRILLVDDEKDSLEMLVFMLQGHGAIVASASSALEALRLLVTDTFDILISDISMPDLDGYQLIQAIRSPDKSQNSPILLERAVQIPAIALTAHASESDQDQALRAGFQLHLTKPVEESELVNAIAQVLNLFKSPFPTVLDRFG